MSKECGIVEDLLPLYHDGVCSQESRELVEAHLEQCEKCRKMLQQIDDELLPSKTEKSDVEQLKSLAKNIFNKQKKALIKGALFTLVFLFAVFAYNSILWYFQEYRFYQPFAEGRTPIPVENFETVQQYSWQDGNCRYSVIVPNFLAKNGHVHIETVDENGDVIKLIYIHRQPDEKYVFHISILYEKPDTYFYFVTDSDLNLYDRKYWDMHNTTEALENLELCREEVQELVDAAKAAWPFID